MHARPFCLILVMTLVSLAPPTTAAQRDPAIAPAKVTADRSHTALLTVPYFGHYSIIARSKQGVALQIVDRMEGPGSIIGVAGEKDGRIDAFLDRGTYRIVTHPADGASGEVTLTVTRSDEQNVKPLRLLPDRRVESALEDHQYRSWWLDLDAERIVALEAAGRHLADLRLWRDGNWLVDASPSCGTIAPVVGHPVKRCTLTRRLPKGLYRVSAYGGPGSAWADESEEAILHLQWGLTRIPGDGGRIQRRIGPFGVDRVRLDGAAREIRVTVPEMPEDGQPIGLYAMSYDESRPFVQAGISDAITKKSRLPIARVRAALVKENAVTVTGPPGQPYMLEWFSPIGVRHRLGGQGAYFLTTMHTGAPADRIDATGYLTRERQQGEEVVETQALRLDRSALYERRFNLAGLTTLHLNVAETGDYVIEAAGAEIRIEPVMTQRPLDYVTPDFVDDRLEIGLPTGPHLLTLRPAKDGPVAIAELAIRTATWNPLSGAIAVPADTTLPPVIQRASIELDHTYPLSLVRNSQGEAPVGIVLRALPVDPAVPLPFTLMPGERIDIDVQATGPGVISARRVDDSTLPVSIDGGPQDAIRVEAGRFSVRIHNDGDTAAVGALKLVLDAPDTGTAPLPTERLGALPVFPRLGADAPAATDLERNSEKTWRVAVETPALYILESTGLLETRGLLRTRTRLNFARENANGVGRNFRVARYLGEGDYQLTVGTQGASRGRLGVKLATTPLIEGGALRPGIPGRRTVPAGRAVAYTFEIVEKGRYRLRSIGQGHTFRCRLEDGEGWPVTRPEVDCDLTRPFDPGTYRVIVLPSAVETRRLTRLERITEARPFVGHGPHPLPAREAVRHVWREPDTGDRTPDWWDFDQPAEGEITFDLSDDMIGELLRREGENVSRVDRVVGGRETRLTLPAGRYRLAVRCARRNDHVPYTVKMSPAHLMIGQSRRVRAPSTVEIAIGAPGLVEIISEGDSDVRARLLDAEGRSLAVADDRPDGWNFRIARWMQPGRYSLIVDPVDGNSRWTRIAMRAPASVEGDALGFGETRRLVPGTETHHLPLPATQAPALIARIESSQNAGVALEAQDGDGWRTLAMDTGTTARVAARPVPGAAHRVRVWSLDQRGLPVEIEAHAPTPVQPNEQEASRGVTANPGAAPAAVIALPPKLTPGVFALDGPDGLLACPAVGAGCDPVGERPLPVSNASLVLITETGKVRISRVRVGRAQVGLTITDRPVRVDLAAAAGPRWIEVRSPIGRPGVRFEDAAAMGVGRRAAAAYAPDGADAAEFASGDGSPLDIRIRSTALEPPVQRKATDAAEETLAPGTGVRFPIPTGRAPRITLGSGLAAIIDGAVTWAADGPITADPGRAKSVVIINPSAQPERFRLKTTADDGPEVRLSGERPFELLTTAAGERRIPVDALAGGTLRLVGAVEDATLIGSNGRIAEAEGASTDAGGVLVLRHGPGPILGWIATAERSGPTAEPKKADFGISGNVRQTVSGRRVMARVDLSKPALLHLRLPGPFVAHARPDDGQDHVALRPAGGPVDVWMPAGKGSISLRGVAGAPLFGVLDVTATPAIEIGEGLGPEVLLAPGESRPFRFTVDREAPVGIGVRAAADRVEATLLDASGNVIGEGPAQMPTLTPGHYVLVLRLPPDAEPVSARAALAGVEPPSDGPPETVIRKYLRLSGKTPLSN